MDVRKESNTCISGQERLQSRHGRKTAGKGTDMGLTITRNIPMITAFLQGLLSFFSPCVLPLLPVYLGYLAGGGRRIGRDGEGEWPRLIVIRNTFFFIMGISAALMLLAMAFSALGTFLRTYQRTINLLCGLVVIAFGILQLGAFGMLPFGGREWRLPLRLDRLSMNPLTALVMGFCFSFSWTPCIGPTLTGILMMVTASATKWRGILLMAVYILGFVLPFMAVGLFTGTVLSFLKRHRSVVRYTARISGILMILMGVMIMTGLMGEVSTFLASAAAEEETADLQAPDFALKDQYGEEHPLSEYRGKVVFLNFWTTWCPWCIREMPDIEEIYHELGENQKDVVILGVGAPGSVDSVDEAGIIAFLDENEFTYPVVMDPDGGLFYTYNATALPTTWLIRKDGQIMGYIPGAMDKETMLDVIQQTLDAI